MDCNSNYLFIISFVVGSESGVALVSAPSESDAKRLLMNSGSRNAFPDSYVFTQCRNLGMTVSIRNELLMESYVNALQAYTAICSMIDRMVIGGGSDPDAYHKPETGIPEYDLEGSVQDAIELAKTALQSFTETDPLSVHITQQSLSNAQKAQARSNISAQETLVSGVNIKTINDTSILGEGNIVIEGGGSSQNAVLYVEQELTSAQQSQARTNIGAGTGDAEFFEVDLFSTTGAEMKDAYDAGKILRFKALQMPGVYVYEDLAYFKDGGDYYEFWFSSVQDTHIRTDIYDSRDGWMTTFENVSGKEDKSNKVTSWSSVTINGHYPSEKLVKDSLDAKYTKPSGGIPASDLAPGVIPVVMVNDVTLGGSSVLSNGVAVLPAYPTTLPASDVSSWAKQSTKPTYSYSEIQDTPTIPTVESMTAQEVSSAVDAAWNAVMS